MQSEQSSSNISLDPKVLSALGFALDDQEWLERVQSAEGGGVFGHMGSYDLLEKIGVGGQGIVYKARQPGTGRIVALKRLAAGEFATIEMRSRFEREIEAAASLDHPHVVAVYGTESIDGQMVLTMRWVDGIALDQWARPAGGAPRSVREVLTTFGRICDGVQHAHQRGVIHRDLKPGNILVDREGLPHVLDFGLARLQSDSAAAVTMTRSGMFMGTAAYAAPEQVRGEMRAIDVRTDVYALGAVLMQALTGRMLFEEGLPLGELFRAIEQREPRRPSALDARLDREIDAIVSRCVAKDREMRYPSAGALAEDVRRYLAGEAVQAHAPSLMYRTRKFVRRHWLGVGLAAAAAAVLLGATIAMSFLYMRSEAHRRAAVANASKAEKVTDYMQKMLVQADPHRGARPADYTVQAMLEEVASSMGDELAGQPEIEAEMRLTMGRAFRELRRLEAADEQLDRAEELIQEFPRNSGWRAELLNARAWLRHDTGPRSEAESLARRAMDEARQHRGERSMVFARCARLVSDLLRHRGRFEESEIVGRQALEIMIELEGEDENATAQMRADLAKLAHDQKLLDRAESEMRRAMDARLRAKSPEHPDIAQNEMELASILVDRGDGKAAGPLAAHAVDVFRRHYDEGDSRIIGAKIVQARALAAAKDFGAAETLLRECLASGERGRGNLHLLARCRAELGILLCGSGRTGEARESAQALLELLSGLPQDVEYARQVNNLGTAFVEHGRFAEAEPLMRAALETYDEVYGQEHVHNAIIRANLGDVLSSLGKATEAEELCEQSIAVNRRLQGAETGAVISALNTLAYCRTQRGDSAGAEELYRESLDTGLRSFGPESPRNAFAMTGLGELVMGAGRTDEAAPLFEEAYRIRLMALGDEHPYTLRSLINVGWVHRARGEYEQAEPCYRRTIECRRRLLGDRNIWTQRPWVQHVQVLLEMNRPCDAETCARELLGLEDAVLAKEPTAGIARLGLGEALLRQERFTEAEEVLRDAGEVMLKLFPGGHALEWARHAGAVLLAESLVGQALADIDDHASDSSGDDLNGLSAQLAEADTLLSAAAEWLWNDGRVPARYFLGNMKQRAAKQLVRCLEMCRSAGVGEGVEARILVWRERLGE